MLFSKKTLSPERKNQLNTFCKSLEIKFKNINLLELALHHRSYTNEDGEKKHGNNERLEFLGDSVLGAATATHLYKELGTHPEGDLAKIKSIVVSEKALAPIATKIGLDKLLLLGKGEEMSGGRRKPAILADAMEALFGAYYLDNGYENAQKFILSFIVPEIEKVLKNKGAKDYKSILQELYQKKYKACPTYELVKKTGPDHDKTFWVSVHLKDETFGPAEGKNKKEAEQNAAKMAIEALAPAAEDSPR
ncbi:MAG: ribonuclease III [Treponema sp.]|nr:ribonuclease III [Treponema sp.]